MTRTKLQYRSANQIRSFYHEQLQKFDRIGLGNKTENDVVVTITLIETTKKRLAELSMPDSVRRQKSVYQEIFGEG